MGNSSGIDWQSMLVTGVSAAIDSQIAIPYGLNNPVYNSQYGPGGQGAYPPGTRFDVYGNPIAGSASVSASASGNPLLLLIGAALVLFLVMRK